MARTLLLSVLVGVLAGLGVDIVEIARMEDILRRTPNFKQRVFTEDERAYCESKHNPAVHYALFFAAKEAVAKALGTGGREDVVAYVAAFMESPQRCGTTLTWDSKAFGWIRFNGKTVVPELCETDAKRGYAFLGGVQKGPRILLFAKVCPLAGGDWRIGFGVLDCRGFKWP